MNLFLTGEVQVGKSTLIRRLLEAHPDLRVGGFRTIPGLPREDGTSDVHIVPAVGDVPLTEGNRVIRRRHTGQIPQVRAYPQVFDMIGCILLERPEDHDLLLMDEIGIQEAEAFLFQRAVLRCLDGPTPVLGVVRNKPGALTDAVRTHPNTKLVTVTAENRDAFYEELTKWTR